MSVFIYKKKRGRPKKYRAKNVCVSLKISEEEAANLDYACKKTGKSRAQMLRDGLRKEIESAYKDDFWFT